MGNTLQHMLVNPNQLQAYSTTVQDNPFASSPLKFEQPTSPTISLMTMGTIIYCNTPSPSDHELSTLPHIPLSSSATWDPHNVVFPTLCVVGGDDQPQISSISSQISSISLSAHNLTSTIHYPVTFHSRLVPRYKFMHHQSLLMSCLVLRHFKEKAGTPQSHLNI